MHRIKNTYCLTCIKCLKSVLKHLLKIEIERRRRNKKKKHNKIVMLAKSKLNSIETLISQALIDPEISHEKFKTIVNGKEKYERMKENIRIRTKVLEEIEEMHRIKKKTYCLMCIKCLKSVLKHLIKAMFTT